MKFGIRLIDYLGKPSELIHLSVLAEEAGFDCVWFPHDTFMRNTWVTTAAVAVSTKSIEIGTVGVNPFTTDPAEIATYIATLDELSGGRAVLGLGLHTETMVQWTGIDTSDYVERTADAVMIVRRLLAGEVVDITTPAFQWSDQCYLRFEPLRADIPIYVCAFGEEYLELSGAIGDGSLPMITPPESAAYMVETIRRGLAHNSRRPDDFDIAGCAWLSIAEHRTEATEVLRMMIAYFGPYLEAQAVEAVGLSHEDLAPLRTLVDAGRFEEAKANVTPDMFQLAITGTPDDVIVQIELLAELGITQVNLGGPIGPDPSEAIRLMGERVIPHFRN